MRLLRPFLRFALLLVAAISVLLLGACRRKEGAPAPKAADVAGELDEAKVMTFLFGNYDPAKKRSIVGGEQPAPGTTPAAAVERAEEEEPDVIASLLGIFAIPDGTPARVLVLTESCPDGYDSHAQPAEVGGVLLERVPAGWRVAARTDPIAEMGSFGKAPAGRLVKLGPERFGISFSPGYSNSGITSAGYSLIAEVDGELVEVLSLSGLDEENAGSCDEEEKDCYAWSSAVAYEPGANPKWLDVVVRTKGTAPDESKGRAIGPFSEETRWSFSNGKYRAVE